MWCSISCTIRCVRNPSAPSTAGVVSPTMQPMKCATASSKPLLFKVVSHDGTVVVTTLPFASTSIVSRFFTLTMLPSVTISSSSRLVPALLCMAVKTLVFTAMHRSAGTNLELLEIVTEGNIVRVKNLETMEVEANGSVVTTTVPSWETTLKSKGFEDAVAHFIGCIVGDTTPAVDGAEGLRTQRMVHEMLHHIQR